MSDNSFSDLRLPDLSDTGLWRLIISVAPDGMSAHLRSVGDQSARPFSLFSLSWPADDSTLLSRIETAVYDNPRILDDFATEIVLTAPRALWVPTSALEEEGAEETLYAGIYPAAPEDILADSVGGLTCLYSLAQGLPAFIARTLPGSRVRSHVSVLYERFVAQTSESPRIYVDIRRGDADVLAFDGHRLLCSSTIQWSDPADIAYRIYLVADTFRYDPRNVDIRLYGLREVKTGLAAMMRRMEAMVTFPPEPPGAADGQLSLATAFLLSRK